MADIIINFITFKISSSITIAMLNKLFLLLKYLNLIKAYMRRI